MRKRRCETLTHTCDQAVAVLVHGDPSRLALEDVIPTNTGGGERTKRMGIETELVCRSISSCVFPKALVKDGITNKLLQPERRQVRS